MKTERTEIRTTGSKDTMQFLRHGKSKILVSVDATVANQRIFDKIISGTYEKTEMVFATRLVSANDRILELGAGLRFISTAVCSKVMPNHYTAVEADNRLIKHIRRTHLKNSIKNVDVIVSFPPKTGPLN